MGFGWLILILIIAILFYLFQDKTKKTKSEAQEMLDKRYANGGISEEEHEEKSRHLREHE
jgi:uncharacterized membrane protein